MVEIKYIGNVELDNPLFFEESYKVKNVLVKKSLSLNGNAVIFETEKKDNANNITLTSKETGWIKENTLKQLYALANEIGLSVPIYDKNGNFITNARFRNEEDAIEYEELYTGSEWYRVTLKLAYV